MKVIGFFATFQYWNWLIDYYFSFFFVYWYISFIVIRKKVEAICSIYESANAENEDEYEKNGNSIEKPTRALSLSALVKHQTARTYLLQNKTKLYTLVVYVVAIAGRCWPFTPFSPTLWTFLYSLLCHLYLHLSRYLYIVSTILHFSLYFLSTFFILFFIFFFFLLFYRASFTRAITLSLTWENEQYMVFTKIVISVIFIKYKKNFISKHSY